MTLRYWIAPFLPTFRLPPVATASAQFPLRGLLPVAGGLLLMLSALILLALVALLLLLWRIRRRRPSPSPPPMATVPSLQTTDGRLHFRLDRLGGQGLVIGRGRHGVDLHIDPSLPDADTVSERHARIYHDPDCNCVVIEDLDSTNGVYINGRRAPRKNLLKDGWVVGLGKLTFTYRHSESDTGPLD